MRYIILLLLLASPAFAAGPLYERVPAGKVAPALARLDAMSIKDWLLSLEQTEIYLKLTKDAEPDFKPEAALPVSPEQLAKARRIIAKALEAERAGGEAASTAIARALESGQLEAWKIVGKNQGKLRITRYFAARVPARHKRGGPYTRALYRLPPDAMRDASGKLPTKQAIHEGALEGKVEAVGYLTPKDEAELHMEGSGILEFDDGTQVAVNYEGNNGYKWTEELEDVKAALKQEHGSLPGDAWPLYKKRHTFHRALILSEFKHLKLEPGQYLGFDRPFHRKMPVQDGVSCAMDPGLVPSGAVAVLIASGGKRARLVKVDDQGAAFIDRPDKIDLFWGSYTHAQLAALEAFPDWGELYFLVAR